MPQHDKLRMSFDPSTIEHLGVKMYSNLPTAMAELIANAYDADAQTVKIKIIDTDAEKTIIVDDDGEGMDFDELNDKFLRIGRNRRKDGLKNSPSGQRIATGKKGLGKLAFFGIGEVITITTIKRGSGKKITFTLKWDDLMHTHNSDYEPEYTIEDCAIDKNGTTIELSELKRKSSIDKEDLASSISKLFNVFDQNFKVSISLNGDEPITIDSALKFKNIDKEFNWSFPEFADEVDSEYPLQESIFGEIMSTEKPLKPGLRGITLFANGRLVNAPEFFGVSESSHGFSYFTGWLDVDFIDDWEEDVISTDRQSLNWDLPKTYELREFLKKSMSQLEREWRAKRNEKRRETLKEKTKIDIPNWYDKLPQSVLSNIEPIVNSIVDDSELTEEQQSTVVNNLHLLVPEYPFYHWRQ